MLIQSLLISLILTLTLSQPLPASSYTPLLDYLTNPYFQVINQTLTRAYNSYLSSTTVQSVYLYTSSSLISMIITYQNGIGSLYRGTANYFPSTRQLSVQSFGPVVQQLNVAPVAAGAVITPIATVYEQENGIGITAASSPPSSPDYLILAPSPSIRNQQISVLLPNSTSTRGSSGNNLNTNSRETSSSSLRTRTLRD